MLVTYNEDLPEGKDWIYQIKYDGFRCGVEWTAESVRLWSRNGKELTKQFPEIVEVCQSLTNQIRDYLPIFLDGELVILRTSYQADFSLIQTRGRMRASDKIKRASNERPATFLCFDILQFKGKDSTKHATDKRQQLLETIFQHIDTNKTIKPITTFRNTDEIMQIMRLHQAEGIIAKNNNYHYAQGKRTDQWIKTKYYRSFPVFLTGWNRQNDYFDVSIFDNGEIISCGKVKHGFSEDEKDTLTTFIKENGQKTNNQWQLEPSVCLQINCLDWGDGELREPVFDRFRFDLKPEDCTLEQLKLGLAQLPEDIEITKPDKLFYPSVSKQEYVTYMRAVAPFILPRLKNKRLTTIRFPDGVDEKSFYQKHVPSYAPSFIEGIEDDEGHHDIVCNSLESLLWLANHSALEFHVPFQTILSEYPDEMVFDLDPPSLSEFSYAVRAAHIIRQLTEEKGFMPLIKTSGRTGLQIHIPLKERHMSFQDTRVFMEAVVLVLTENFPDLFTIERLKKKRKNRLYLDYVQHAPGKTIIAPYSCRATKDATVATPLYWEEVNKDLHPSMFTVHTVPQRLIDKGCPWNLST